MSTEFNIPIKLENKNLCNGCPLLRTSDVYPLSHTWCKYFEKETQYRQVILLSGNQGMGWNYHRPDLCKDKFNEQKAINPNSKWDDLNYNEKEALRKKRPEVWRKLYREKFGVDA